MSNKLLAIEILDINPQDGFIINLQVGEDGITPSLKARVNLSPHSEVFQKYQLWADKFRNLKRSKRSDEDDSIFRKFTSSQQNKETKESNLSCTEAYEDFVQSFRKWLNLNNQQWQKSLRKYLDKTDEIRVIIQTNNLEIQSLPWHLWELFSEDYPRSEIAISLPEYQEIETTPIKNKNRVRILAIFGNSKGLDLKSEREEIQRLPGAEVEYLENPDKQKLIDKIQDKSWDILFFAGHSETSIPLIRFWSILFFFKLILKSASYSLVRYIFSKIVCFLIEQIGYLQINSTDTISISDSEVKSALANAINHGLKLAIFNSCQGLGLARELANLYIPQVIVMREPIPDDVARDFLKQFIRTYSRGKSLYTSMRETRKALEDNWKIKYPGASCLPVICQNPAVLPMSWLELRQGFRSTSLRTQIRPNEEAILLNKVRDYWIEGLLNRSLHNRLRIEMELGVKKQHSGYQLEERQDAIYHPWGIVWEDPSQLRHQLPPGTRVIDVLDQMGAGGTLLILGEPASGKTYTLLELAEDKIAYAQQDINLPSPVVFNLSTWKVLTWKGRQSFADWLVKELREKYHVNQALSQNMISEQKLLLLLDGLDEVRKDRRDSCVEAINEFIENHGKTEIVICSRVQEYELLKNHLRVQNAIFIEPLTKKQIENYLHKADAGSNDFQGLRIALESDSVLQRLARSPLWLNIMTLLYKDCTREEISNMPEEERRKDLLDKYIRRALIRRKKEDPKDKKQGGTEQKYSQKHTLHWLVWLAERMVKESESIFLIERIQPNWLSSGLQRQFYRMSIKFIVAVVLISFLAMILVIITAFSRGFITGFVSSFISSMILMMQSKLQEFKQINIDSVEPIETLKWSWSRALHQLFREQTAKMITGGIVLFFLIQKLGLINIFNSINSGFGTVINRIFHTNIIPIQINEPDVMAGLIAGGLLTIILDIFLKGIHGPNLEKTVIPNQGIWISGKNSFILAAIFGLIAVPIWGLTAGIAIGIHQGLIAAVFAFPIVGGSFGLYASLPSIQHFMLRIILKAKGYTPWNYANFLDQATERIFLQKVGGGYIFIHRLLQEHFAQMTNEDKLKLAKSSKL